MEIFCADTNRQKIDDERSAIAKPAKYQVGVLEDGWQYRSKDDYQKQPYQQKRPCLPPFKSCSVYKTSYKFPPSASYERDYAMWRIKEKAEGQSKELLEGDDKACRENFTTTTDLVYRILPQLCPRLREYNSNALEWFPPQNLLPCYGNLTQHGLKEAKKAEWEADLRLMTGTTLPGDKTACDTDTGICTGGIGPSGTTYENHFRKPPQEYLIKDRRALPRQFSSTVDSNNNSMVNQTLRGKCALLVPIVDASSVPMPECRFPLPIAPCLPEDPPYKIGPRPPESKRREIEVSPSARPKMPLQRQQYPLRLPVQVC